MQLSSLFALALSAAASVSGMAIEPVSHAAELDARGSPSTQGPPPSCPPAQPNYCGWFNQGANQPPHCVAPPPQPQPHPKPICIEGKVAYCARDPGHFCPYDETNAFCIDDGITLCECFDASLVVEELEQVLGDIFCPIEKAFELLGSPCLCGGPGACISSWINLDLGCTVDELLQFTIGAVVSVVTGVLTIL